MTDEDRRAELENMLERQERMMHRQLMVPAIGYALGLILMATCGLIALLMNGDEIVRSLLRAVELVARP